MRKIQRRIAQRKQAVIKHTKHTAKKATMLSLPSYTPSPQKKIAIIQTGSYGDNINSTLMLKPLKQAYPDCIIDVHTSTLFGSAFHNNPYITNVFQHHADTKDSALHLTLTIPEQLVGRGYDMTFAPHPMFNHGNWNSIKHPELGDNLICAWIRALEHADIPYEWPLETVLRLTNDEIVKVTTMRNSIPHMHSCRNILMEVQGESGQSFWTPQWTMEVAKHLLNGSTNLFISRRNDSNDVQELKRHAPDHVFFVGGLTLRECAELFNHCQAFFSVSSGLSNVCNTNWCKKDIKWFEVINSPVVTSAPIRSDGKTFWLENNLDAFINMLKSQQI